MTTPWRHLIPATLLAAVLLAAGSAGAGEQEPSFVDPTATVKGDVEIGHLVYVAPFAELLAGRSHDRSITIGDEADVQDSVVVDARQGSVELGDLAILAHGAVVLSHSSIGEEGTCPGGADHCASFIGFNAEVDGGIVEKDAMVLHLARVAPGVRIPSGLKVLPGKNVASQAQVAAKTAPVTDADRAFMAGVIEVNVSFAEGYSELEHEDPDSVRGINVDPGGTAFNPTRDLPTLAGTPTREPRFRNRIVGDVRLADSLKGLNRAMQHRVSIRADEGEPFTVGSIDRIKSSSTFHALEHTSLKLGDDGRYGRGSLIHGGPADFNPTTTGNRFDLGTGAVFFRSAAGDRVTVGCRSLVQQTRLPDRTVVPPMQIWISGAFFGEVEWGSCR